MLLVDQTCTRLKSAHGVSHRCAGMGVECAECSAFYGSPPVSYIAFEYVIRARRGRSEDTQ